MGGAGSRGGKHVDGGCLGAKINRLEQLSEVRTGEGPGERRWLQGPALCGWLTEAVKGRTDSSARGLWRMKICGGAGERSSNVEG